MGCEWLNRAFGLGAVLFVVACGGSAEEDTDTMRFDTESGESGEPVESSGVMAADVGAAPPACVPAEILNYGFSMVEPLDSIVPADQLLVADCVFQSLEASLADPASAALGYEHQLLVEDCVSADGVELGDTLSAGFVTLRQVLLGLEAGAPIRVQFAHSPVGSLSSQYWYSLRGRNSTEVTFAAFATLGPTLELEFAPPQMSTAWSGPITAELGSHVCDSEEGPASSAPGTPRRASVQFRESGETVDVVSGTTGSVVGYLIQLGFAGTPDNCDGEYVNMPIEGLFVAQLPGE